MTLLTYDMQHRHMSQKECSTDFGLSALIDFNWLKLVIQLIS